MPRLRVQVVAQHIQVLDVDQPARPSWVPLARNHLQVTADSATVPNFNRAGVGELVPVNPCLWQCNLIDASEHRCAAAISQEHHLAFGQGGVRVAWFVEPVAVVFRDEATTTTGGIAQLLLDPALSRDSPVV